ncbi:MAG: lysophospholipid acyltransferase family protein [Acidaminococcaceae bacterium]
MLGYWAMKALSWVLCHSPKFIRKIFMGALGSIAWAMTPAWRKNMAVENIKECLGVSDERAQEIAEESVRRFGRMLVEVLRFPTLTPENFRKSVSVEGAEYLEAAYKQDKGVILCTGHYGNWELLGASVALMGYPILSIARKQNNSAMDNFINEYRELTGQKITYNRGENSMLAINRIIKDKKILGVLYDQDSGADGMEVLFFGKPSMAPTGAALLSRIHGAPMVPLFIHNEDDEKFTIKIHPPLYAKKTADRIQDLRRPTEELMLIAEHEIISDPSMWFWVHDRWKDGKKKYKDKKGEN